MSRPITKKHVQIHQECKCGANDVYHDSFSIPWTELSKHKIKRKRDKRTGEYFLLWHYQLETCDNCNPQNT